MKGQRRRWEDLNVELLVQVFERVDMESLLLDVPFVCQSWHKASLDPKCWKTLIFPDFEPFEGQQNHDVFVERGPEMLLKRFSNENQIDRNRCSITAFIKFVVNHSKGTATMVKLPECCTTEAFQFLADVCPGIVTLALPDSLMFKPDSAKVVGDFKNLEVLSLDAMAKFYLDELIGIIDENCEKFWGIDLRKPYYCCLPGPLVEDCEGFVILLPPGCEHHHDVEEERIPEFASQSNPRIPELAARVEPLSDGLCTRFLEWVLREPDE